ncbi:MAG: hypothetical protein JHC63_11480 [Acidimicrobiia bacterium]|nr:hypothetical protein [Acidimicrobiia bacterium]
MIAADVRVNEHSIAFSICTLVSNWQQYDSMIESFLKGGFGSPDCEFLYLDNSCGNRFEAYRGINIFLSVARGSTIILCHQDVELIQDDRVRLESVIHEMNTIDPSWGLLGNAGGLLDGSIALRLSDPHGEDYGRDATYPIRAVTLDENFMVVRKEANLAVSGDLHGYHMYGADLALVAERLGYTTYIVDFHLRHHGRGSRDEEFFRIRKSLVDKLSSLVGGRVLVTTCTLLPVGGSQLLNRLAMSKTGERFLRGLMKLRRWSAIVCRCASRSR